MNTTALAPEERAALAQLARHPGWYVLMRDLLLPQMLQATQHLDRPSSRDQSGQADFLRGVKHAYRTLIEDLYHVADLPSPLEQHSLALLATLRHYGGQPDAPAEDSPASAPPREEPRRHVSQPV